MKYLLPLMILVLLAGCGQNREAELPTQEQSGGICAIYPLGSDAVTVKEVSEGLEISALSEDLTSSEAVLLEEVSFSDCEVVPLENHLWIADKAKHCGFRIDYSLSVHRISLPEDYITGTWQGESLYYTTADSVRALEAGTMRLVKQMPCGDVSLVPFGEGALCVSIRRGAVYESTVISSENGVGLDGFSGVLSAFFGRSAVLGDGAGQMLLTRDGKEASLCVIPGEILAIRNDGRFALSRQGKTLYLLDAQEKTMLASMELEDSIAGCVILEDSVIILKSTGDETLVKLPFSDWVRNGETVYGEFATQESPLQAQREKLKKRADVLTERFGIPISIESAAVGLSSELQPLRISCSLDALEAVLPSFPRELFQRGIKICIVAANENPESDSGGYAIRQKSDLLIAIAAGTGQEDCALLHNFSHLLDGAVMTACSSFDNWQTCNPENFGYGMAENTLRSEYAGYFASQKAMQSPGEDRAELFMHACMAGQAEIFRTEPMQRKLLRMCTGIRIACNLEHDPRIFRWEQYLYRTLAPPSV